MVQSEHDPKRRNRRWGPVIVGLLFLFAAVGISVDRFASHLRELSRDSERAPAGLERAVTDFERQPATTGATSFMELEESLPGSNQESSRSEISSEATTLDAPTIEAPLREAETEDLKISLDRSNWKGGAQLLPNPLAISSVVKSRGRDIRGGGWLVIDVANSRIEPVELFKNPRRGVIEARYLDGRDIVNPTSTGFPVVRGISGLSPGGFEVFENPSCIVRYSGVSESEICEVRWRNSKLRFRFEAPELRPEEPTPDFIFTTVSIDVGPGDLSKARWQPMVSFNESFHPIGDVNRDGFPDFYVESVTAFDESGVQHLVVSNVQGLDQNVTYVTTTTRFRPRR